VTLDIREGNLRIGAVTERSFSGQIYSVAFWAKCLTSKDIESLEVNEKEKVLESIGNNSMGNLAAPPPYNMLHGQSPIVMSKTQLAPISNSIVVFQNRSSGNTLDHYNEGNVVCNNNQPSSIFHHWKLVPTGDGFFALVNCKSGKTLDHFYEQKIVCDSFQPSQINHQWEVIASTADGYYTIRNRKSGLTLDGKAGCTSFHPDHISHQWKLIYQE
jgi:hypothetical protein